MDHETKTFKLSIKEFSEEGNGGFTGYLSVFNNVDRGGDMVMPGAFTKTLQENAGFPLYWAHQTQDHESLIGSFYGKQDGHGLLIDAEYLPDQSSQAIRQKVRELKQRKVKIGLSIGYVVVNSARTDVGGEPVRQLKEIKLYEGSLTSSPMNDEALIQAVKQDDLEQKPYPNEHACRLNDPGKYSNFRRGTRNHEGKAYSVIYGQPKGGGGWEEQAYRYAKDTWSADEARAHCKAHEGSFEAASGGKTVTVVCGSCGEKVMEIYDPVSEKALDTVEPGVPTPQNEPPAENKVQQDWALLLEKSIGDLTKTK